MKMIAMNSIKLFHGWFWLARICASAVLICASMTAGLSARAQDFDLSRDFSTNSNPHGVFSYGWESALGGTFNLVTLTGLGFGDNGVPYEAWTLGPGEAPFFAHFPLSNSGTATSDGGQGQYPPGTVVYYTGADGSPYNYAIIRFTAPSNGTYHIGAVVKSYLNGPSSGDVDFHVLSNNVPLLDQFLAASTGHTSFSNILILAAGDTIDFAVGRGADGIQYGSGLNIQLVITPAGGSALPFITQQPHHVSAKTGTRAVFQVIAASSTPVEYQWYFNGEAIAGETGSTLVVRPVRPRDAGPYSVRVTNEAGSIWAAAALTVELGRSGQVK
jgi:hypothetical protein